VNILDENIPRPQRELLESWRIRVKQIGVNVGRRGMQDEEIIRFLKERRRSTFFSRDSDFHSRRLCHAHYGIVHLAIHISEVAIFVRRLLRHPDFNTYSKRMGKVIRVSSAGISFWQMGENLERRVTWSPESMELRRR
jgi:hypothetical protein